LISFVSCKVMPNYKHILFNFGIIIFGFVPNLVNHASAGYDLPVQPNSRSAFTSAIHADIRPHRFLPPPPGMTTSIRSRCTGPAKLSGMLTAADVKRFLFHLPVYIVRQTVTHLFT
jgi:hypothetical protein